MGQWTRNNSSEIRCRIILACSAASSWCPCLTAQVYLVDAYKYILCKTHKIILLYLLSCITNTTGAEGWNQKGWIEYGILTLLSFTLTQTLTYTLMPAVKHILTLTPTTSLKTPYNFRGINLVSSLMHKRLKMGLLHSSTISHTDASSCLVLWWTSLGN